MQEWEKLKDIYRTCVFNKKELEERLGIDLTTIQSSISVSEELRPFLSRKTIQLKEAANILAGYNPFHWSNQSKYLNDVKGYRASLWDAVDNNILVSKNLITYEDFGQEWRDDITLNKNEVTKWANKFNYNWSLPIDDEIEESNQYNSELLQRIKQLEIELEEQKKNNSESIYIPPLDIIDTGDLTEEINQLKLDNQKLTEQLNEAKQEIEKLTKQVPILLGHHRHDDLLLLAIKTRNDIWGKYTDEDPNYKPLSSTQIKNKIKRNNPHLSDRELSSIELVACPLKRGN